MLATIRHWDMLPPGSRVGVAVSGGADSVALLEVLRALAPEQTWKLTVLHVNHCLRGAESETDAAWVSELAGRWRLRCHSAVLPVPDHGNVEQEARRLRLRFFRRCLSDPEFALDCVALGHTRSDQAETVLFRVLRGTSTRGLAAMRPIAAERRVRPLCDVSREDTRDYLRERGQVWREDSSNRNLRLRRNRIRLELLPALRRDWNPAIETALAQVAECARAEEEYWEAEMDRLASAHLRPAVGPALVLECNSLRRLPVAISRRLIRRGIEMLRGDSRGIEFHHIERIRFLLGLDEGSGRVQIPGVDCVRSFDQLRISVKSAASPPVPSFKAAIFSIPVAVPGEYRFDPSGTIVQFLTETADWGYNEAVNRLGAESVPGPLVLRLWRPGDAYAPSGRNRTKIADLFQIARIPVWERLAWPVLTSGEKILWSRRFGVAAEFAATSASVYSIAIRERDSDDGVPEAKLESDIGYPTSI